MGVEVDGGMAAVVCRGVSQYLNARWEWGTGGVCSGKSERTPHPNPLPFRRGEGDDFVGR